ncbi:copper resistance protein A precursor [Roseomonas sp. TAS13]|jgi:CopA family copper-resistance protein|uniref:Copper-resistance protein, CopA family n=1 Tax=Muricoccus roseus TaxID=198092 RepID=A0A1M6SI67_9PROT|nr:MULTISPECIES: multicopper oxidase domain-containing protein [Roseomonas]PZR08514.1 MAG: copper oxidase [Azospirillum brasilense]USQ74536.1 multicopper oxidase domain-containing protein [Roseomonas mucosa]GAV34979.1 copper resistance protein A precursor [Roseomonas sp. TAS13]SHK44484.1 copper-resistance protein, CopA family [Roseomonas rosea]
MSEGCLTRRSALSAGIAAIAFSQAPGALAQPRIGRALPREFNLALEHTTFNVTGRTRPAMSINGQIPGPVLRFREGEEVIINVTNKLRESASIHWHGLILPSSQDGVPGISDGFNGIAAGATHQYRFPLVQSGTYWYHSHSGVQEQAGIYAPLIIDPLRPDPYAYGRDYIVQLSDWTDENPERIISNLKRDPGYYNYNKRTLASLVQELRAAPDGAARSAIIADRKMWGDMRMDPTDIEDVSGYTYLVNGRPPERNFTAVYRPGETVRLRFINSGAMTHFDVRIPGVEMTVVQAHGNNVRPVTVDEFRIAPSETYDVLVRPAGGKQYQILAETMGRQGFASASLATQDGLPMLPLPPHRPRPVLTMADMGGPYGPTGLDRGTPLPEVDRPGQVAPPMDMSGMDHSSMAGMPQGAATAGTVQGPAAAAMDHANMPGMDHSTMPGAQPRQSRSGPSQQARHNQRNAAPVGIDHAAMGHGASAPAQAMDHAAMGHGAPARGQAADHSAMGHGNMAMPDPFTNDVGAPPGARVLSYRQLRALSNPYPVREPSRIIEVRLTGNMERYIWSINGNRLSEAQPIVLNFGERVRMRFINETMMNHPMHLHGVWMQPQVGNGNENPLLHVVNVKPGTTMDVDVEADAEGGWGFHCHLLYHMEAGMMRKVEIRRRARVASAP